MRKVLCISLVLTLVLGVFGIASASAAQYKIGFVVSSIQADINATYYNEVLGRIRERGHVAIGAVADNDDERYIQNIENFIQSGVDAIIIGYGRTEAYRGVIKQAYEAGIPVVGLYAGVVDGMLFDVASNDFAMSAMVSKYMADRLRAQGGGEIAVFFSDDMYWSRAREAALHAVLTEYPDIQIAAKHAVNWTNLREDAMHAATNMLLANPSIKAFWGIFDLVSLGAAQAIQGLGRDDVFVVGIDGDPETINMIASTNVVAATVRQQPRLIAHTLVDRLLAYLDGEWEPLTQSIDVEALLVTPDNVCEFLPKTD